MSINKYLFGTTKTRINVKPRRTKQMRHRYSRIKDARGDATSYANQVFKEYPSLTDEQKKNMINYYTVVGRASAFIESSNLRAATEELRDLVQEANSARILTKDINTFTEAYQAILNAGDIIDKWLTEANSAAEQEKVWRLPETALGY